MNDDQTYEVSGFEGDSSPDIYGEPDGLEGDTRESHEGGVDTAEVPDAPGGYEVSIPENIEPFLDEGMLQGFQNVAHRAGLTRQQGGRLGGLVA